MNVRDEHVPAGKHFLLRQMIYNLAGRALVALVGWVKRSGPINTHEPMGPLRLTHPTGCFDPRAFPDLLMVQRSHHQLAGNALVGWVKRSGPINAHEPMGPLRLTHPTECFDPRAFPDLLMEPPNERA